MAATIMDGKALAAKVKEEVRQQTAQMGIGQHTTFQHTNAIAEESKRSLRSDTRIELA